MAEEIKYSGIEGKNIFSKGFKTLTASVCQSLKMLALRVFNPAPC